MIYTNLTPEIINIYKGSFNNELLTVSGGYMNYKKYANSPEIIKEFGHALDTSEYSEKELETAEIYYDLYGNYIPEIGDKLIFFGIRDRNNETENYYVTYSNQGIFYVITMVPFQTKLSLWTITDLPNLWPKI